MEPWERVGSAAEEEQGVVNGRVGVGIETGVGGTTGMWEWEELRTPSYRTQSHRLGITVRPESIGREV